MNLSFLQIISIVFEVVVAILGIMLATAKKKSWGWCIALCFAIYVFYDISNLLIKQKMFLKPFIMMNQNVLYAVFFVASISILWAVWQIYKEV